MGSLASKMKTSGGGGYLNNVDIEVTDLNWVVGDTYDIKKGKNAGKGKFTPLNLIGEFQQDGLPAPTIHKMLVGNAEDMTFEISDDGKDIEFSKGSLYSNSVAGVFLNSCEKPTEGDAQNIDFGDEDNKNLITVSGLLGARMRVQRIVNDARKPETGKDGKPWPARDLVCVEMYALGEGQGAAEESDEVSVSDQAKIALLRYLEKAPGQSLPLAKIKTKIGLDPAFATDAALRASVTALAEDPAFLKTVEEIAFDGKTKTLTLREEVAA